MLLAACFAGTMLTSNAQTGLNFDGVNDYVDTNAVPITGNSARTVEAWIKTTKNSLPSGQGGDGQSVILDWGSLGTGGRFTFNALFNNAIRLEVQGNGVSGNIAVNDGEWHHVAAVYDPSAAYEVRLYVDGVLDVENDLTVSVYTGSSTNLRIGARIDDVHYWQGGIDEVRVWNIARTLEEIQSTMDVELCSDTSNLVAYYKFNEGTAAEDNSGITSAEDTAGVNDGTLENFSLAGATSNWVESHGFLSLDENTLTALQSGATYQWIDCDNGGAYIDGATEQSFTPEVSGTYAVEITLDGCMTTSECMEVASLGIETSVIDGIKVYPNPTSDFVTISLNEINNYKVTLVTITGQIIGTYSDNQSRELSIDLQDNKSGIYFLNIEVDGIQTKTIKVVRI